mgnify:CR=1 FL=1
MKRIALYLLPIVGSYLLLQPTLYAADLRWSGFGSFVMGKATNQEPLPGGASSTFKPDAGVPDNSNSVYKDSWTMKPDTLFGLQVDIDMADKLSATAQVISKGAKDFDAEFEWLYVGYALTSSITVNIGRQRAPLYNYSDFQDVGYAYHWTRPPLEVYGEEIFSYEGVSMLKTGYFGDWDYETQAYLGSGTNDETPLGDLHLENWYGAVFVLSNDEFRFRVSGHAADIWTDGDGGKTTITTEDSQELTKFVSAGAFYDPGAFLVGIELTYLDTGLQSDVSGITLDSRVAWMITAGYRIGEFTPNITVSHRAIKFSKDGTVVELTPPFGEATALVLAEPHDGAEQISQTIDIGLRWDFHPQAAAKLSYIIRTDDSDDIIVDGGAPLPALGETLSVNVLSFGIDFIF